MLIDVSYFTAGPRRLMSATKGTQSTEVRDAIENCIAYHQLPFLVDLLGDEVGNELHSYLCQKDEGEFVPDEALESLCKRIAQSFADYVFFHIIRDSNDQATITGVVRLKGPNTPVSPMNLQVSAWNGMVERNKMLARWCASTQCDIPGIVISPYLLTPINRFNL